LLAESDSAKGRIAMGTTLSAPRLNSRVPQEVRAVPIVCIGLSAGGIWPLKTIFEGLCPGTGLAFVVIHHLRSVPTRLPQLLSAWTEMGVELALNGGVVCPNSVYVLPSGMEIALSDGSFALQPQRKCAGFSNVLTLFLKSLSKSGHLGVAVILSGVDADGAAALEAFRRHGGITIAQDPRTAERKGMPVSAIRTGVVDEVLPPEAIAHRLNRLAQQFNDSGISSEK